MREIPPSPALFFVPQTIGPAQALRMLDAHHTGAGN